MRIKLHLYGSFLLGVVLFSLVWFQVGPTYAGVCSEGVGIPPFLEAGAEPNLLLMLDNSGSMLDMAYDDENSHCLDETYDVNFLYAGYFETDTWYKWQDGLYLPWESGKGYIVGDRVYVNGIIWEADSTGSSTGGTFDKDEGVVWKRVLDIPKWANATYYEPHSFVWSGSQLYYTDEGGTSNDPDNSDGLNLSGDIGLLLDWIAVDSTWRNGGTYESGNIVTDGGIYYEANCSATCTAAGTSVHDDTGMTWQPLDEGLYVPVTQAEASTFCSTASGAKKRTHTDLCISINEAPTPDQVTAFAARGNFLNWTITSKFDIQKKILTGGKYNDYEELLVSEHRGCSGSRFKKQIQFTDGSNEYLTFGVRGSKHNDIPFFEDRIDTTDEVGRLEILAITAGGYSSSTECKALLVHISDPDFEMHGANLGHLIDDCLDSLPPTAQSDISDQRPMLNQTLQFCSSFFNKPPDGKPRNLSGVVRECECIFKDTSTDMGCDPDIKITGSCKSSGPYLSSELEPAYGAYMCYGIYDSTLDHINRAGYLGRCWNPGVDTSGGPRICGPKPEVLNAECGVAGETCEYGSEPDLYKNEGGYNKKCNKFHKGNCKGDGYWDLQYEWSDDQTTCNVGDVEGSVASGACWEDTWETNPEDFSDMDNCILQAAIDYCGDLLVPEVIDPSDDAGTTTHSWGIPALIGDSELFAQLGTNYPLAVMKGYIRQVDRPEGVLHEVADKLRLGVMAFNYLGAKTECDDPVYHSNGIDKYCPLDEDNKDGAHLLKNKDDDWLSIKPGTLVVDNDDSDYDTGERRHIDELVESINAIQATSWTPLAEAMFNAIGYYTQNSDLCLSKDVNGDCSDFPIDPNEDPVDYWCQDNHILIITEGESTADMNATVAGFVASPSSYFGNIPQSEDVVTGDLDGDSLTVCDSLAGSTYLDDMTWWGAHSLPLYAQRTIDDDEHDKQSITSHLVTTGLINPDLTSECDPRKLMLDAAANSDTPLYEGEDPDELEDNLRSVFNDIFSRASAGSAASVISSSRSGSGAVYQAIFWPELTDSAGNTVEWVGDIHALLLNSEGLLYEDTDSDGVLTQSDDKQVIFYYSDIAGKSRGCYNFDHDNGRCFDDPSDPLNIGTCGKNGFDDCVEIRDIKYLWSANEKLRDMTPDNRNIFTWNDLNNNGIVEYDNDEVIDFRDSPVLSTWGAEHSLTASDWAFLNTKVTNRGNVTGDFISSDVEEWQTLVDNDQVTSMEVDAMNALVSWIRGNDQIDNDDATDALQVDYDGRLDRELRSRKYDFNGFGVPETWPLGDIIHSTPTVVGAPAEAYHLIYRDPTYADFATAHRYRRQVVYVGGNDGMLHAYNGGYYYEHLRGFCCAPVDDDGVCEAINKPNSGVCSDGLDLGEELWAYIPYNLQPHLKCLTDKQYSHKYFVDQKPRIFDVQIFEDDATHVSGWGTILVGSMRFGGAPVNASDQHGNAADERIFTSAFFVLDITDPENPELLGEMTMTSDQKADATGDKYVDLNYTTSSPTMIVMKDDNPELRTDWYLVMGSGPTDIDGANTPGEPGRLAVIPLEWLTGSASFNAEGIPTSVDDSRTEFRIPNRQPDPNSSDQDSEGGMFQVPMPDENASFISDLITVDFDVENTGTIEVGSIYRADAVYFGTTDGTDFGHYSNGDSFWNGGGRLFRLVTKVLDVNSDGDVLEKTSKPSEWAGEWSSIDNDPIRLLVDAQAPITAAPSVGFGYGTFWVYAGTGRFYDKNDKTDIKKQRYFGIREPVHVSNPTCGENILSWDTILWDVDNDSGDHNQSLTKDGTPGERGLMRTDAFLIAEEATSQYGVSYLEAGYCYDNDENSLTPDHCEYDPVEIASLAGVDDISHVSWPSDIPTTTVVNPADPPNTLEVVSFQNLRDYIAGTGCANDTTSTGLDGWYREFHDPRERNIGQAALLGGLLIYTGYRPDDDICEPEGESFIYGVHFETGTAWKEDVFGQYYTNSQGDSAVVDRRGLGRGVATTPSMHVGTGENDSTAFVQTSTGEIIRIEQENLPIDNTKSGRSRWSDRKN